MSYPANFTMLKRGFGITDAAHTVQKYPIGATFTDENGNVFEYAKTASAVTIPQYGMVILLVAGCQAITTTLAAAKGTPVGIAMVAVTAITSTYQYLWVQRKTGVGQNISFLAAGDIAAYAGLFTTATAGKLDDAYVATCQIDGMGVSTANTGAVTNAYGFLQFPMVRPAHAAS